MMFCEDNYRGSCCHLMKLRETTVNVTMPYISLRRKATVVFLCLVSFTLGCFLTKKFSQRQCFEGQGNLVQLPLNRQDWSDRNTHDRSSEQISASDDSVFPDEHSVADESQVNTDAENACIRNKTTTGLVKHHYLVEFEDPLAAVLLRKAILQLPPHVMASVATKNRLKYDKWNSQVAWPTTMSNQRRWAVLIDSLQQQGYEQRLPVIITLGVKKSGTTAFLFYIGKHPQIARSIYDEIHYFSLYYDKGVDFYRSRMGFSTTDKLNVEKSQSYFVTQDVPERIFWDRPGNLKFVVCVRDPVERAISDFRHENELKLNRGRTSEDMEKAEAESPASQAKEFEQTTITSSGEVDPSTGFIDEGVYSKHFKNWLGFFPRDQFYILSHERVEKDIYTELKNVEKFLGLEPFYEKSMFYYDEKRQAPCMHAGCPPTSTPGFLPKADLSPEVIRKLRDFFRPYNQEFEKLTQMQFSWTNL